MFETKQFQFRVTVKDIDRAFNKVKDFFAIQGITTNGYTFSGKGFEGEWAVADHDVIITLKKKPLWAFNSTIVSKCKEFLKDV